MVGKIALDQKRILAPQSHEEETVGSYTARAVEPDALATKVRGRNHMIELRWRRNLGVEIIAGVDENSVTGNAAAFEQRRQQRVFVLAISILVMEHVGRRVRLVAT